MSMFKNLKLCVFIFFLPIVCYAQVFSEKIDLSNISNFKGVYKQGDIILEVSNSNGMPYSPVFLGDKDDRFFRFQSTDELHISGNNIRLKEVVFTCQKKHFDLKIIKPFNKVLKNKDNAENKNIKYSFYRLDESSLCSKLILTSVTTRDVYIKSIKIVYEYLPLTISISEAKRATLYYSDKSLVVPAGIVAWTYKIVNNSLEKSHRYNRNDIIPNGTAVVLEANKGTYEFVVTAKTGVKDKDNVLKGSDQEEETKGGQIYYAFRGGINGVGFYWMNEDGHSFKNGAHKAYIAYNPPATSASAKPFFAFDTATNIHSLSISDRRGEDESIYNLAGQRVSKDYKGIIIMNGKKYLKK